MTAFAGPSTINLCGLARIEALFASRPIRRVAHMAAMAGVRYSAERAALYADVNVTGGAIVLDAARRHDVEQVVLASTSNIYGDTAQARERLGYAPTVALEEGLRRTWAWVKVKR